MWIMTSFGILMPAEIPAKHRKPGDEHKLQIRTRREHELTILRAQYMPKTLGPTIYTPDKDYEYRAYADRHAFGLVVAQMVTEIDYAKFKPTTHRYHDNELHSTYNAIWGVVSSRMSTPEHQTTYWHSQAPAKPAGTVYTSYTAGRTDVRSWDDWDRREYGGYSGTGWAAYEPEVWDNTPARDPALDKLYAEIDDLIDETYGSKPMDHAGCDHSRTDNARARCRRRRRKVNTRRMEQLRSEITSFDGGPAAITAS